MANLPFVDALTERIRTALGAYLDCRRARPDLVPRLQAQADMALRHFARQGNVKWASLLMWAGADPRSVGPTIESGDDPEMFTTAMREACAAGHLDVLKRLRPDPTRDDLDALLEDVAFYAHEGITAYLLDLGAKPTSRAIDRCLFPFH